ADDREDALERGVQADVLALLRPQFVLQKLLVRVDLNRKQVRDRQNARQLPEILTNAFLFSERICHVRATPKASSRPMSRAACQDLTRPKHPGMRTRSQRRGRWLPITRRPPASRRSFLVALPLCHLIWTVAPASSSCFLMLSASSFATPSLTVLGAPSTRSFASFRPRPVTARITLMTATLLSPKEFMTTSNSVCSSAAAAASPPAPGAAATATGAAAETPHFSSRALTSSTTSMIDLLLNASISSSFDKAICYLLAVDQCVT